MLWDFAVPPAVVWDSFPGRDPGGSPARQVTEITRLAEHLAGSGTQALRELSRERLLAAWGETVESFLDPHLPASRALRQALAPLCGLSPAGVDAGLEAVLGGVRRPAAEALLASAAGGDRSDDRGDPALAVVFLASNLPALAVQPLLPALLAGRPVLLKSPSAEPLFAPTFVRALGEREPALREAVAAITWPGGSNAFEAPLLAIAGKVVAYGAASTLEDLRRRLGSRASKLVGYGPRTSLAVVSADADLATTARGLARDVALFDQRGCLSVSGVLAIGPPAFAEEVAKQVGHALAREAETLPPGPALPAVAAAVRQLRAEAEMRGLFQPRVPLLDASLAAGTVVVDPTPAFRPSPGLRALGITPLEDDDQAARILAPWRGRLQGAALAGAEAWSLAGALAELGCTRLAPPGQLQSPDATWHNGGRHPMESLGWD